jgi:nucleotide-binding universal stress UspA family protein
MLATEKGGRMDCTTSSEAMAHVGVDEATATVPFGYRTVLLPLDGSTHAERALGPAGWLARRLGAELHVIAADVKRPESQWYRNRLACLVDRQPGITAHRTSDPDVAHAVRSLADELAPTLVCVATHGWASGAAFVGPTFATIAAASTGPVVAVGACARSTVDEAAGRIVAVVDGTSASEAVLPVAADWARGLGIDLSIVTVAEPTPPPIVPGADRLRGYGPEDPDGYIDRLLHRPDLAGLDVDGAVIWDASSPHIGVLTELDQRPATLLALASRIDVGIARVVTGHGEASRIIETSPLPVLLQPLPRP